MSTLLDHPSLWRDRLHVSYYVPHFACWFRSSEGFPAEKWIRTFQHSRESVPESWLQAVAEEWLLAWNCGAVLEVPEFLKSTQPFPGAPPWEKLLRMRSAPVLIPLDCQPQGALARVWVLWDQKGVLPSPAPSDFHPGHAQLNASFSVHVSGYPASQIRGDSWQLGAWLAAKALQEGRSDLLPRLASSWLVTGKVSGNEQPFLVDRVELGTKALLVENKGDAERSWLLPAGNEQPLEEAYQTLALTAVGRIHFARSTADAWSHVSGEGVVWTSDQDWPKPCAEVHGFVSNALGPFLAIILQSLPSPVVLWTTPSMTTKAQDLRTALDRVLNACEYPERVDVRILEVPDATQQGQNSDVVSQDLLSATERVLASCPSLRERKGPRILFNNTGGNFLHRTAAVRRAALNSRIWLAYRDINDRGTPHFSLLRHELGQILTGRLLLHQTHVGCRAIHWQDLVKHFDPTEGKEGEAASEARVNALVAAALYSS